MKKSIHSFRSASGRSGFTLVELLVVIAVVAILASILGVGVKVAITKANVTSSKVLFSNWVSAFEQYKAKYGFYPSDFNQEQRLLLNDYKNAFIFSLTGRQEDGSRLSNSDRKLYNRSGIRFYSITEGELDDDDNFVDSFGNSQIYIKIDHDNDGFIKNLPSADGEGTEDIRAKVVIFTDDDEYEQVLSWE